MAPNTKSVCKNPVLRLVQKKGISGGIFISCFRVPSAPGKKYRPQLGLETVTNYTHTLFTFPKGITRYAIKKHTHIYTLPTASQQNIHVNF